MIKIVLKRSYIGVPEKQQKVLEALGLRKVGQSITRSGDKATLGMIRRVAHLVSVEKAGE